jgi:MFS family permease
MTIGELILVPTSSTYVANLAPADKRGRYMSIYGLSWSISTGIGSLIGGTLNDVLGLQAIWYGGAIIGFFGVLAFLLMKEKTADSIRIPVTP